MAQSKFIKDYKLEKLDTPEVKIRKAQTDHEAYHNTRRSIAVHGILQNIMVTKKIDGVPHPEGKHWLVDGLQRTTIAKELELETAPADVYEDMSQEELLLLQDTLNSHRIPQKPKERLQHYKRLMIMHPEWTIGDLAKRACETEQKVRRWMQLGKLTESALELVDNGTIKLSAGVALAALPQELQDDPEHLKSAAAMPADKWIVHCQTLKEAARKAKASGKDASDIGTVITPHPRKRNEMIAMWQNAQHDYETKGDEYTKGRVEMAAEMLQVDDATINAKKEEQEKLKLERQEKAAKNKMENAQSEIAKVMERKKLQDA